MSEKRSQSELHHDDSSSAGGRRLQPAGKVAKTCRQVKNKGVASGHAQCSVPAMFRVVQLARIAGKGRL